MVRCAPFSLDNVTQGVRDWISSQSRVLCLSPFSSISNNQVCMNVKWSATIYANKIRRNEKSISISERTKETNGDRSSSNWKSCRFRWPTCYL